jgi:SPP1 family predicted phage head-tail adaptor
MRAEFVDPGALRTELSLQQVVTAADGMGGHAENWSEVATVFGRVGPVSARARFGAGQTLEEATHLVTLRFRQDLASGMRLVRGGRAWSVLTVHDPDETGRYLVCRVTETGR